MYEPPTEERAGCGETWALTRAAFAVLIPVMLALFAVFGAIIAAVVLFNVYPALALLPAGAVALGIYAFARWERSQHPPPDR